VRGGGFRRRAPDDIGEAGITTRRRTTLGLFALLLGGVAVANLAAPQKAFAEKLRVAHSTWVGFGPLYIARDKGFFTKRGVDVDLVVIEGPRERFAGLHAGQLEMVASTVDTALLYLKKADDFQYVVALDDSSGGDGIVADKSIKSVADLKGKKVAFSDGSVWQFYLDALLAKAGLTEAEIMPVAMSAGDAGAAFVAGKVDAAVTWEPWLTKGKHVAHGHLLVDSSANPGLITDVMVASKALVAKRGKEVKGVVDAWNDAVAFQRANPEEAAMIMAKGVGGWLRDPKMFAETLTGIRFYGADENKKFFGTQDKPGPLGETTRAAIEIWSRHKRLAIKVKPEELINYGFVNG
jgi:NitT/TauT family transport system substrate-binding protein